MAKREAIAAAVQAALWALSNGHCYAPGCPFPVIFEVRPQVYEKNAQMAHIYAVKEGAARYRECLTHEERRDRDSFKNLILVCLAHHAAIDNKKDGERLYPPELLLKWKKDHEGKHAPHLARIGPINEEQLGKLLTAAFTPPITRLERIADQLDQTGTLNREALDDLREVVAVMKVGLEGPDARTVRHLAFVADVLSNADLARSATRLGQAAETFSDTDLSRSALRLAHAAEVLPDILKDLDSKLRKLGNYS